MTSIRMAMAAVLVVVAACGSSVASSAPSSSTAPTASDVAPTSASDGSPTSGPSTPQTTAATTTKPSPSSSDEVPTTPIELPQDGLTIEGRVVAFSPDGWSVLVERLEPGFETPGCEGVPQPILLRVPLAGGEAEPAVRGADPLFLSGLFARTGDGRAVIVTACEGYLGSVHVFDETPTGDLVHVRRLDGPFGDPPAEAVTDIDLLDTETLIMSAARFVGTDTEPVLLAVDLLTGVTTETTRLMAPGTVVALADGFLAVDDGTTVRVLAADGTEVGVFDAPAFAARHGGRTLAFYAAIVAIADLSDASTGSVVDLQVPIEAGEAVAAVAVAPDDATLAIVTDGASGSRLLVGSARDGFEELVTGAGFTDVLFSPDGGFLAIVRDDGTSLVIAR